MYMLQDLNKDKIIQMKWIKGEENSTDLGTNHLDNTSHTKYTKALSGKNDKISNFHHKMVLQDNRVELNHPKIVL